jgi:hypothetical protein
MAGAPIHVSFKLHSAQRYGGRVAAACSGLAKSRSSAFGREAPGAPEPWERPAVPGGQAGQRGAGRGQPLSQVPMPRAPVAGSSPESRKLAASRS